LNSNAGSDFRDLYSINLNYNGTASVIDGGYKTGELSTTAYKDNSKQMTGEFQSWENGAPALGTGDCNINSNFSLSTGIEKARNEISSFDRYIKDQMDKTEEFEEPLQAFVMEANYTTDELKKWDFTMANYDMQNSKVNGWVLEYINLEEENNTFNISGYEKTINNPIMTMEEIPTPLTICSAETVMTDFEEIAEWAENENNVNYDEVILRLGQNLVSKQSLSSPTSIISFGSLDLVSIFADLSGGDLSLNLNDYSNNINVDTAGSYAYFLDKKGLDKNGNNYQKVAGVDAKDGLVLFNIQSINTT